MTAPYPPAKKRRVAVLIDGFNLYHAIDDCPHFHAYKWLDPIALAGLYVHPTSDYLIGAFFYTAVPVWNDKKRDRHERLIAIYEDRGVVVCRGKFMPTTAECRLCGREYGTYQEKETDINIALNLTRLGNEDLADRIVLVTGDNDQAPAVRDFRTKHKDRSVVVVLPPFRRAKELEAAATEHKTMASFHLKKAMLPNPYVFKKSVRPDAFPPTSWANAPEPQPGWRPREDAVRKYF